MVEKNNNDGEKETSDREQKGFEALGGRRDKKESSIWKDLASVGRRVVNKGKDVRQYLNNIKITPYEKGAWIGLIGGGLIGALGTAYILEDIEHMDGRGPSTNVPGIVDATIDSIEGRVSQEYDGRIKQIQEGYDAQRDSLERVFSSKLDGLKNNLYLNGTALTNANQRANILNGQIREEKLKSERLQNAVTPFLSGSPDSARVMRTILSGNAMILTGETAKEYDPRAEAGEVYVFEKDSRGEPVGFGYRLGGKK